MIHILFGGFLVFFVFDWIRIRKVAKHDGVLFPLCQLRRDLMRFLYDNVFVKPNALSHEEYVSIRRLSDALDDTIHNYNQHKTLIFNFRKMVKYLRQHRHTLKRTALMNLTDSKEIQEFHARFSHCLARAFLAYTPLIHWELLLRLMVSAYSNRRQQYVLDVVRQVRNIGRRGNVIGAAA